MSRAASPHRKEEVEADLRAQAPRLGEPVGDVRPAVDLQQAEVDDRVAGAVERRRAEHDEHEHQHEPVGREDAQEPAPEVGAGRGLGPALQVGEHEGPVQQEPGDQEEDRHADVHAGEVRAQRVHAVQPGHKGDVREHDGRRRDRPQTVEAREVVGPGAGRCGDGTGRALEPANSGISAHAKERSYETPTRRCPPRRGRSRPARPPRGSAGCRT